MANYNKVILVGNLTRDPEVRYTPSGTAVAHFGLAVNRTWRSAEGENREEVLFIDITAFGRRGEIISEYCHKGDPILIEGRLQMESWQGQDGQRRTKHVVVVDQSQFLGRRGDRGESGPPPQRQSAQPRPNRQAPQEPPPPAEPPEEDSFGGDDIPF